MMIFRHVAAPRKASAANNASACVAAWGTAWLPAHTIAPVTADGDGRRLWGRWRVIASRWAWDSVAPDKSDLLTPMSAFALFMSVIGGKADIIEDGAYVRL